MNKNGSKVTNVGCYLSAVINDGALGQPLADELILVQAGLGRVALQAGAIAHLFCGKLSLDRQ